jgi:hypothetical protein
MQHLANGSAPSLGELPSDAQPPFRVLSSDKKPCDPFVAICYEGHWFWGVLARDDIAQRLLRRRTLG